MRAIIRKSAKIEGISEKNLESRGEVAEESENEEQNWNFCGSLLQNWKVRDEEWGERETEGGEREDTLSAIVDFELMRNEGNAGE